MSDNNTYQPINCDDYDNLELACQKHLILAIRLRDGEVTEGKAIELFSRKSVEYLRVIAANKEKEVRLDKIESFSHHSLGTIVIRLD